MDTRSSARQLYDKTCQDMATTMIRSYSTSFQSATRLLPKQMRIDIANVYALVRLADEIVDTYKGKDMRHLLDTLERDTLAALDSDFSSNPILHAFSLTAGRNNISAHHIKPFFSSMRFDIDMPTNRDLTRDEYETYIYGSAEVVGLMCLQIFWQGDEAKIAPLEAGAKALGSAFQKVNFLRDIAYDRNVLQRRYFPLKGEEFNDARKTEIVAEIAAELAKAQRATKGLPKAVQPAVKAAASYFEALNNKLQKTSASTLLTKRIRVNNAHKSLLLARAFLSRRSA